MSDGPGTLRRYFGAYVLAAAVVIGAALWLTAPTPERRPLPPALPLVTVHELARQTHHLQLEVHGRVEPLTRVELMPEVTGRIVGVHDDFVPGGPVPRGEALVRIDARDYVALARIAEANLKAAEEELRLEEGRQRAALAEWKEFGGANAAQGEEDLATRGPQRRMQEAMVERHRALLVRAQLDVERCTIRLSYDAVVETVAAAPGSLARPGQSLGTVYPVGASWVRATLPVEQLRWVEAKGRARVYARGSPAPIVGAVREISPNVQERGSLGQVLVEIPLAASAEPGELAVRSDEFVRVELQGRTLEDVFVLPRSAVHGESQVWLVNDDDQLVIRDVVPIYAARDGVIVREGLTDGDRLITSQLSQPVTGMGVRISEGVESAQ